MTTLRERMLEDLQLHGLSESTQALYVQAVRKLAEYYHKSPDRINEEELRQYFLYLSQVKKVAPSTLTINSCGIKFFYEQTLQVQWAALKLIRPPRETKLPVILSISEVHRILDCIRRPNFRICLSTIYACGLRIQEGVHLQVKDIDSQRGVLHVCRGKGNKDRYVPLSEGILIMKPPAECKYTPFEAYLRTIPEGQPELTLSFAQIEAVMNSTLPKSAYLRLTRWNNEVRAAGLSHKNAWIKAGWNVKAADLAGQSVHFARVTDPHQSPIILTWGESGGTRDSEADKKSLVSNEIIRLKIRHHPRFQAYRDSLTPHTRQVFDLLLEEDATPELIILAQEAPDEEWKHFLFLGMLGGGNPDSVVALLLTNLVLHEILCQVKLKNTI